MRLTLRELMVAVFGYGVLCSVSSRIHWFSYIITSSLLGCVLQRKASGKVVVGGFARG